MATPEPTDPASPTRRIEPAAPTDRLDPGHARTRWVTRILRPGAGAARPDPSAASGDTRRMTGPAARPAAYGPSPASGAPTDTRQRTGARAVPAWFGRLVSRVVVGPAGELDYAIPAELRRAYNVLGHIGSGGEAVVYLAEPESASRTDSASSAPGQRLALKVYRPGHDINRDLLDRLRARGEVAPYTPAIHGYGYARSSWGEEVAWEAQEYFAEGSLRSLMDQAPVDDARARDIVAAIGACLHHWQDSLQHNHTDVKPENLLIRRLDPPVFALTDFGGAVRATMSRVYGGLAITEDYAAPEVVEGRREAPAAWWSLGIMVHELVTGRRPERGENWLAARSTEIDVSAIADEDWRLLARGLLNPMPSARWGYSEVRQWLAGERPQLVRPRSHAPITFADVSHEDPPSLAFDLLDRSDKGEVWLRAHWPAVRTWLDREVNDYTFDRAYLTDLHEHPERVHLAISALAAHYVPGMPPRYRGHEVSAEGVLALAAGERSRHAVLREAIELEALDLAARHWCEHSSCRAEAAKRCALLERVQHEVPLIMQQVQATAERLARTRAPEAAEIAPHEWDTAWAQAVELVLDPDAPAQYRRRLRARPWQPGRNGAARHADWWREQRSAGLRRRGDPATNAALITAVLLLPTATRIGAAQRERNRADNRARRHSRWAALASAANERWSRTRERLAAAPTRPRSAPPTLPLSGDTERQRLTRQREEEQRRVDKGMRQIQRAMGSGRCRRFAYPAALFGMIDSIGRLLRADGFYPETISPFAAAYEAVLSFSQSTAVSAVSTAAGAVAGLLPGDMELRWWLPALLGLALFFLGRTAANRRRKARTQIIAYRMAVFTTVLTVLVLLANGLLTVGAGVLIPLHALFG
ncbi:MAG: serine/threonine protein kinase [Nocardiopsaceae bacterium]|nr:serine/threonine protein kinase [Nocardiopsaceae bacterium]